MDVTLMIIVTSLGFYAMVGFIVLTISRGRQRRAEMRSEMQEKMIEKLGSAPELAAFLQSDEGQRLMTGIEHSPREMTRDRILSGVRKAIVLSFLGASLLVLCIPDATRNEGFMIAGGILLALGLGYFVATLVSLRLSRSWGLTRSDEPSLNL